jgi:hypothetical protein
MEVRGMAAIPTLAPCPHIFMCTFALFSPPQSTTIATYGDCTVSPFKFMHLQTIKSRPSDQGKKVTASIYFALAAALAFLALAYLVAPARFLASAFGTPGESMDW